MNNCSLYKAKLIFGGGTGYCSQLLQSLPNCKRISRQMLSNLKKSIRLNFSLGDVDCKYKFKDKLAYASKL